MSPEKIEHGNHGDGGWWKPAGNRIKTRWTKNVDPSSPLPEYPRPQMVRARWLNLNGAWAYTITRRGEDLPCSYDGKILVPFAVESSLSGVMRRVGSKSYLWYKRTFTIPSEWKGQRILLHFGAVDWEATIFFNGHEIGVHRGGFTPFTFDVTDHVVYKDENVLEVRVHDPTNTALIARGKQTLRPGNIFYTAVTGIWQTVWMEPVPDPWIDRLHIVPDLDAEQVSVRVHVSRMNKTKERFLVRGEVLDGDRVVSTTEIPNSEQEMMLPVREAKRWSPASPFLYGLNVRLDTGTNDGDEIKSYFGMRKIAVQPRHAGSIAAPQILLNGEPLFQRGVLDQGYWPDGLYTAPTDDALRFDIEMAKSMGFNILRKHIKVEPDRWYYHCDRLGMLVWQDMPSLLSFKNYAMEILYALVKKEYRVKKDLRDPSGNIDYRQVFLDELDSMIGALFNHPCIVTWVPFNEGWGEECFDVREVVARIKHLDPTRLVDNASGWYDKGVGDVRDVHAYPGPSMAEIENERAAVNGEFGGLGLKIAGHVWNKRGGWGYKILRNKEALEAKYLDLMHQVNVLRQKGLVASIYTQLTDVETEVNGLMTYDREFFKIDADALARMHRP
ncbi:MAG: glycoside hydrolase family 2 protein [Candidatus Sigynarchaeota archaeon]